MHRMIGGLGIGAMVMAGWLAGRTASAKADAGSDDLLAKPCPAAAAWMQSHKPRRERELKTAQAIKPSRPALARALAHRAALDQAARNAYIEASSHGDTSAGALMKRVVAVDASNLAWLKSQVLAHGFPTVAQVGGQGVENAWLLTQHADRDTAFQAGVLAQLKAQLKTEPFMRQDYAMLSDRVRLAQGHKQVYGSQLRMRHGAMSMRPVIDPARLDQRRAAMDLMPIADYCCVLGAYYHAPATAAGSHTASAP